MHEARNKTADESRLSSVLIQRRYETTKHCLPSLHALLIMNYQQRMHLCTLSTLGFFCLLFYHQFCCDFWHFGIFKWVLPTEKFLKINVKSVWRSLSQIANDDNNLNFNAILPSKVHSRYISDLLWLITCCRVSQYCPVWGSSRLRSPCIDMRRYGCVTLENPLDLLSFRHDRHQTQKYNRIQNQTLAVVAVCLAVNELRLRLCSFPIHIYKFVSVLLVAIKRLDATRPNIQRIVRLVLAYFIKRTSHIAHCTTTINRKNYYL